MGRRGGDGGLLVGGALLLIFGGYHEGLPMGTLVSIVFRTSGGHYGGRSPLVFPCPAELVDGLLRTLAERAPQALIGYDSEVQKAWRSRPDEGRALALERRAAAVTR